MRIHGPLGATTVQVASHNVLPGPGTPDECTSWADTPDPRITAISEDDNRYKMYCGFLTGAKSGGRGNAWPIAHASATPFCRVWSLSPAACRVSKSAPTVFSWLIAILRMASPPLLRPSYLLVSSLSRKRKSDHADIDQFPEIP